MSQMIDFTVPSTVPGRTLHAFRCVPEGEVKAVLQLSHGMVEFIDRYKPLAEYLAGRGILVTGHDHLGHGGSIRTKADYGYFAEPDGNRAVLADLHAMTVRTKALYPGVPYFLLGHSMGSFFGRRFITHYGEWLDGAIFMGTGSQPEPLLWLGGTVVAAAAWLEGRNGRNERLHQLVLGSYNRYFEKGKTEHQWLSRVTEEDEKYEADPYCQFLFTDGAFVDFFQVMLDLKRKRGFDGIPKNLPILLISGEEDPVGEGGRGVRRAMEDLQETGCTNVAMQLYPGARHELFHEINREEVFGDIVDWVSKL